jgi:cytochrome c-type biogenesis protein CcmE
MTEMTWEKPKNLQTEKPKNSLGGRWKFLVGGLLILGAVAYMIYSSTLTGARFFITVEEVVNQPSFVGETVRLTGAVVGDTIQYNPETGDLAFTIAHIPQEYDDLATVLHLVANDPTTTQLQIVMQDEVMPDLLQHEAQAIITGKMGEDGKFHASELLLKCPSRFQEDTPGNMIHITAVPSN